MNVALGLNISSYGPYEGRPLTVLHHPDRKVWPVLSPRSQGNVVHLGSTSNRVSKSFGISLDKVITGVTWTNVVTLSRLPRLERLASLIHAPKVP